VVPICGEDNWRAYLDLTATARCASIIRVTSSPGTVEFRGENALAALRI
jgi:hypothetical protein